MSFEFAIIGNTPMAALLACSLSKIHGRKTAFIGQFPHILEPIRGFDLSISTITRPQTLKLLKANVPILQNLLKDFANIVPFELIDPLFIAHSEPSEHALLHMKNVASLYGFNIEKQAQEEGVLLGLQCRDITRISRHPFFVGLTDWLKRHDVKHISSNEVNIKRSTKEGIKIVSNDETIFAQNIIYVGDDALLEYMPKQELDNNFYKVKTTSLMLEPIKKINNSTNILVDENTIYYQHNDGSIDFIANGSFDNALKLACNNFNKSDLRLAGKAQFTSLIARDGAGVFGNISSKKITYIAGFGISCAFLVPAMANILTGKGSDFENEYFALRKPSKTGKIRNNICEYCAPFPKEIS